jgi:Trypsin-co-occurring domain 1
MPNVEVLVLDEEYAGGLVGKGASSDQAHAGPGAALKKVLVLSSEHLVAGVTSIAREIGPSLQAGLKGLSAIDVKEVSIGCTIGAHGTIMIAGVGAEASLTITFKVS